MFCNFMFEHFEGWLLIEQLPIFTGKSRALYPSVNSCWRRVRLQV